MKKLLVLSLTCLLLAACGGKDDDNTFEKKGYLTSLDEAKKGIVGVWEKVGEGGGVYYYGYDENGQTCDGFTPDKLTYSCTKYEILKINTTYMIRVYTINSTTNNYNENPIKILNEQEFIYTFKDGKEYKYTRVK